MISTLVYDLDDTLYSQKSFSISGFKAVDRWFDKKYKVSGLFEKALNAYENGERHSVFNLALKELNFPITLDFMETIVNVYREHYPPEIELFPDAVKALDHFKNKNQAVITDGHLKVQQNKIKFLKLDKLTNFTLCTASLPDGNSKPSQLPFQKVMEHFNVPGSECVYIGDNPLKDFIGAKALGWNTIRIRRPGGEHTDIEVTQDKEADTTVTSLIELADILEPALS